MLVSRILVKYALLVPLLAVMWFAILSLLPNTAVATSAGYADVASQAAMKARLGFDRPFPVHFALIWGEWFAPGTVRSPYSAPVSRAYFGEKLTRSLGIYVEALVFMFLVTGIFLSLKRCGAWFVAATEVFEGVLSVLAIFVGIPILLLTVGSWVGSGTIAAFALSIFPSMQLNNSLRYHLLRSRRQPWHVFARFNGMSSRGRMHMVLRELQPPLVLLFNACGFLFVLGIPAAEWMLDIPGLGRWMIEALLRLDIYIAYFASMILTLLACIGFMAGELIEYRMLGSEEVRQ